MFRADGLAVYSGGTYTITFEARAEHARQLRIALEGAGVTNPFEHIELTTEWQTFTIIYEAHSDVFNRTFAFWFGSLTTERDEDLTFTAEDDVVTTVQFRNFAIDRN